MKKLLTLIQVFASSMLFAQAPITINATDMPVINDTLRYSTGATTGLNATTIANGTGANYVWNFSSLTPTDQLLESFKSSASTPYLLYFSGMVGYKRADSIVTGPVTQKNVWDFFKTTVTKYSMEGTGFTTSGIPLASNYSDPDEIYNFPLNYTDKDSSTFKVTTTIPTIGDFIQAGTRTTIADGWGKITTPFGTFDVLRIRSFVNEVDTIKITNPFPLTFPFPNRRTEYKWIAKGVHIPILEIVINTASGAIQTVKYRDQFHVIPKAPTANFMANITFPKVNDTIKLIDKSIDAPTRWKWTITPTTFQFVNGTNDSVQNIDVKFSAIGNYTVSLVAQNNVGLNTATKNAYIKVGSAPVIAFGANNRNVNIGDIVTLADSSANTPNQWKWTILPSSYSFNPGSVDTLKSVGVKFNKGGFYTIDLKVTNPWGMDQITKTNYIWVFFPAGINPNMNKNMIAFPNPVHDIMQMNLPSSQDYTFNIFNVNGSSLNSGILLAGNTSVDVQSLPAGVYILEVQSADEIYKARFVKW